MGVFIRPDSQFFQLYLERVRWKESTRIPIRRDGTKAEQRQARQAAEAFYRQRMAEIAAELPEQAEVIPDRAGQILYFPQAGLAPRRHRRRHVVRWLKHGIDDRLYGWVLVRGEGWMVRHTPMDGLDNVWTVIKHMGIAEFRAIERAKEDEEVWQIAESS